MIQVIHVSNAASAATSNFLQRIRQFVSGAIGELDGLSDVSGPALADGLEYACSPLLAGHRFERKPIRYTRRA